MTDAFVVGGVRTPIGNLGGGLSDVRPDDLARARDRRAHAPISVGGSRGDRGRRPGLREPGR